jgi:hypothetical protein
MIQDLCCGISGHKSHLYPSPALLTPALHCFHTGLGPVQLGLQHAGYLPHLACRPVLPISTSRTRPHFTPACGALGMPSIQIRHPYQISLTMSPLYQPSQPHTHTPSALHKPHTPPLFVRRPVYHSHKKNLVHTPALPEIHPSIDRRKIRHIRPVPSPLPPTVSPVWPADWAWLKLLRCPSKEYAPCLG